MDPSFPLVKLKKYSSLASFLKNEASFVKDEVHLWIVTKNELIF